MMYSDPRIKPATSKKWVPPGYITRNERDESYWNRRTSVVDDGQTSGLRARSVDDKHHEKDDSSPERGMLALREGSRITRDNVVQGIIIFFGLHGKFGVCAFRATFPFFISNP
jgi:hypothetical protein